MSLNIFYLMKRNSPWIRFQSIEALFTHIFTHCVQISDHFFKLVKYWHVLETQEETGEPRGNPHMQGKCFIVSCVDLHLSPVYMNIC